MDNDWKLKIGIEFDSFESAWKSWSEYGAKVGFGVRKDYANKNKKDKKTITSCRFVCCKEGLRVKDKRDHLTTNPRAETRTNCMARISLKLVNGKFRVNELIEDHNHILLLPETTHMLACQRKLSDVQAYEIELAENSGVTQRTSFAMMSKHAGGRDHLGITRVDLKNYLRTKRQKSLAFGEATCLLHYFQEQLLDNPSFFHAYQVDSEEQITNIFWADARMILDYGYFGDVVSFDTTYSTNKAHRPLAVFSGFNHHHQMVIFGAALLYDETVLSFQWLFHTFLEAHNQKKPQTIFTDQDQAMAKALYEVLPETSHLLCTWHLNQNCIKHLGPYMKDDSHLLQDFEACMYEYEQETEFEAAWSQLLSDYNLQENTWMKVTYSIKEKWAACHVKKLFTMGARSTQLSESLNNDVKKWTNPDVDIIQFLKRFEQVVEDKRYNELKEEFACRIKLPQIQSAHSDILNQVAEVYTRLMFEKFQKEFDKFYVCRVNERNESGSLLRYLITMKNAKKGEWVVFFNPQEFSVRCSCKKFESFGLLCCHIFKVFIINDVETIPDQYILKRFSRDARSDIIYNIQGKEVIEDPRSARTSRYRELSRMCNKASAEVSGCEKESSILQQYVHDAMEKVKELRIGNPPETVEIDQSIPTSELDMSQPTGIKKRFGRKSRRRMRNWVDLPKKTKKRNSSKSTSQPTIIASQSEQSMDIATSSQVQYNDVDKDDQQFSFTRFLMGLDQVESLESFGV